MQISLHKNGRSCLLQLLKKIKSNKLDQILIPNYICDVIFQPLEYLKFKYNFYNFNEKLQFSFNEIKKKITKNTKAVMIVNYFGYRQSYSQIYNFLKKKNIALIVDSSHRLPSSYSKFEHNHCDAIFFSNYKFGLAGFYGGSLIINNKNFFLNEKKNNNIYLLDFFFKIIYLLKTILKKYLLKKVYFLRKRPKYENINNFNSKYSLSNSYIITKKLNFKVKKNDLHKKFQKFFKFFLKSKDLQPVMNLKKTKRGIPLFLPLKIVGKKKQAKILDKYHNIGIKIVTWPTLHSSNKNLPQVRSIFKKYLFFEINE